MWEEPRKPGGAKDGGGAGEGRQTDRQADRPAETHRLRERKTTIETES